MDGKNDCHGGILAVCDPLATSSGAWLGLLARVSSKLVSPFANSGGRCSRVSPGTFDMLTAFGRRIVSGIQFLGCAMLERHAHSTSDTRRTRLLLGQARFALVHTQPLSLCIRRIPLTTRCCEPAIRLVRQSAPFAFLDLFAIVAFLLRRPRRPQSLVIRRLRIEHDVDVA